MIYIFWKGPRQPIVRKYDFGNYAILTTVNANKIKPSLSILPQASGDIWREEIQLIEPVGTVHRVVNHQHAVSLQQHAMR
mmetsp:Transcript_3492/g.10008  ORF Transcript_3492/g.10008 Transcript_3492/m.10008 type:complete len:80 (+) Transcript_3492:358-597(+)